MDEEESTGRHQNCPLYCKRNVANVHNLPRVSRKLIIYIYIYTDETIRNSNRIEACYYIIGCVKRKKSSFYPHANVRRGVAGAQLQARTYRCNGKKPSVPCSWSLSWAGRV